MATQAKAVAYVTAVREAFKNERGKYNQFLQILKDFRAGTINGPGAAAELEVVLGEHRHLIEGLNIFLPKDHQIPLPSRKHKPPLRLCHRHRHLSEHRSVAASGGRRALTTADALAFVNDVRRTLRYERQKYDDFLQILRDFRARSIGTAEVAARVKRLFEGHRNLIVGFKAFLPKGFTMELDDDDDSCLDDDDDQLVLVLFKLV